MKIFITLALCLTAAGGLQAQMVTDLREVTGFAQPESALWWEDGQLWIVSNVNGPPAAKDGNGFLSLVSPTGTLVVREWIGGMDGPKGMALTGDELWVADLQKVRRIKLEFASGVPKAVHLSAIEVPGAIFLNDLVFLDARRAVISDTQGKALYLVEGEIPRIFSRGSFLGNPNGLAWSEGGLQIAQFRGAGGPGKIISVEVLTGTLLDVSFPVTGALDGLVHWGDRGILTSDFSTGKIYLVQQTSKIELWSGTSGSADLGFNPSTGQVAVPNMNKGTLTLFTLEK